MYSVAVTNVHNSKAVVLPKNRYMPSGTYTRPELKAIVRTFNQLENFSAARFIRDMMID
jgi:hypothetical protein